MSALPTQPLEVTDFSFGITDYFIDGEPRYSKTLDNLFLTPHKKLVTRFGSNTVSTQLPLGLIRVNKLTHLRSELLAAQSKNFFRLVSNAWVELLGPSGGTFLPTGNSNSVITTSEWQNQLFVTNDSNTVPQKLFYDGSAYKVVNAGLPALSTGFSVTNPTGSGNNYLYVFVLKYTYFVDSVEFLDRSDIYVYPTTVTGGVIGSGNTTNVTIPATISPVNNLDTANLKIEIYRTQNNGSVFYYNGEVSLGTILFVDNKTDAVIGSNETLYTTSGVLGNTAPPMAKYVHIVNDFGYWANISEGGESLTTEVRQSKFGDPDSVPPTFYSSTDQPITGLSSIYDRPMVFCERFIYRIDNFFSDDGSGGMILRRIDDKAGCVSQDSIIQTHLGIFWAGREGFYWSDAFNVVNISDHINETYKSITSTDNKKKNIVGTFDPSTQRVFWTASKEDGSGEPDLIFTLDLKFGFKPDGVKHGGTFTVMNGDAIRPTQILMHEGFLYRGDATGYVFKHGKEFNTDPKVNTAIAPNLWQKQAIKHTYSSCFLDFGTKFYRKWVPRILISAGNATNLSLAVGSSNDNDRVIGDLKPIRYRNNITWGDSLPLWDDSSAIWNSQGLIEEWRRFPAGGLRCNYKQINLTNAIVSVVDSRLLGTATVNRLSNTVTLGGAFNWLPEIVDYFISFEHDNYEGKFKVISQSSNTLVYEDLTGTDVPVDGVYNWILCGAPKGEVLQLNGYVIHYAMISKSHTPFSSSSLGGSPT